VSQDIKPVHVKRCYACIQWDGTRSFNRELMIVKVDPAIMGFCRIHRSQVKGSHTCSQFFPLR
jgi:hypothetical protein